MRRGVALMLPVLRPYAGRFGLVFLLALMATGLSLAQPLLTKALIDDGILGGNARILMLVAAALVAVAALGVGVGAVNRRVYIDASARALFDLRGGVFRHLLNLSPRFYATRRTGELMSRLDGDVAEVQRFVTDGILSVVSAAITLVLSIAFMVMLSPVLTLVALAVLPLEAVYLMWMRPRLTASSRDLREKAGDLSAYLVERLSAVRLIQGAASQPREADAFRGHQDDYRGSLVAQQMTAFAAGAGPQLLTSVATAVVFVLGGLAVIDGALTLGALIAFASYLARAVGPLQTFLGLYAASARAEVSLDRVLGLLDEPADVVQPVQPVTFPDPCHGQIVFDHVTFAHGGRAAILTDASAMFPAHAKIGIVGASGSGKSSLVDLLARFQDPQSGRILLDGADIRELDLAALRRAIAVVAQDTILLDGSLADNLRYGTPQASDAEIVKALRAAKLDELIGRLPQGVDTRVGERGARLSGGERQRLAIARALLADPSVLVLDEATTGIDAATERDILATVDRLFGNRTRIVISHHPRTLLDVEQTFRLADGQLVLVAAS